MMSSLVLMLDQMNRAPMMKAFLVHFACAHIDEQNFPPSVALIVVAEIKPVNAKNKNTVFAQGELKIFNIVSKYQQDKTWDDAEREMLKQFFDTFMLENSNNYFIGWNIDSAKYGAILLEGRYHDLVGRQANCRFDQNRLIDLDDLLAAQYGLDYANHPKLYNLLMLNSLSSGMAGRDEATLFVETKKPGTNITWSKANSILKRIEDSVTKKVKSLLALINLHQRKKIVVNRSNRRVSVARYLNIFWSIFVIAAIVVGFWQDTMGFRKWLTNIFGWR